MTLREYLTNPATERLRRRSITLAAAHLKIDRTHLSRILSGKREPGKSLAIRMQDMVHAQINLYATEEIPPSKDKTSSPVRKVRIGKPLSRKLRAANKKTTR